MLTCCLRSLRAAESAVLRITTTSLCGLALVLWFFLLQLLRPRQCITPLRNSSTLLVTNVINDVLLDVRISASSGDKLLLTKSSAHLKIQNYWNSIKNRYFAKKKDCESISFLMYFQSYRTKNK